MNGLTIAEGRAVHGRRIAFIQNRNKNTAGQYFAVTPYGDRTAPRRDPARVICCAVDRVNNPLEGVIFGYATFFTQNGVIREVPVNNAFCDVLAFAVHHQFDVVIKMLCDFLSAVNIF